MTIYDEISEFAQKEAAIFLGAKSLSGMALETFRSTLEVYNGQLLQLLSRPFVVRFDGARAGATALPPGALPLAVLSENELGVKLRIAEPLVLSFSLGVWEHDALAAILATIELTADDLSFQLEANGNSLAILPADSNLSTQTKYAANLDDLLARFALSKDLLLKVEGMLCLGGLASAIAKTLSSPQKIDLQKLVPGVSFEGKARFSVSSDNKTLFVGCSKTRRGSIGAPCDCAPPSMDGLGPVIPGIATKGTHRDEDGEPIGAVGKLKLGGPSAVDPSKVIRPLGKGVGDCGLFLSTSTAKSMVDGVFPAIRIDLSDNGQIGWSAAALIDFSDVQFALDENPYRLVVKVSFRAEVFGRLTFDLGKLGRKHLADFNATQNEQGANSIKICIYPQPGKRGIYLKPVLEDIQIGDYSVELPRIGTLVGSIWPGWGTLIGYIFDKILAGAVGYQLPRELELQMYRSMAQMMFTLLEFSYAAQIAGLVEQVLQGRRLAPLLTGGAEGLLLSVGIEG